MTGEVTINDGNGQTVKIPLTAFVKTMAREAARVVIEEYASKCPIHKMEEDVGEISRRTGALENKFYTLLGFMAGSGLLGGSVSGAIVGYWFS